MPVMVTGAHTAAGRAAARAFLRGGGQVRAFVPAEAEDAITELRALGCKVARGDLDDEGRLELALEQVHTVVHLDGGFLDPPAHWLDGLASAVGAAIGARCRRFIWPSTLGVDDEGVGPAGPPDRLGFLHACAEGEELLAEAPLESVVIRRALTYGPGDAFTDRLAAGVPPEAAPARHAPLYVEDLAAAVVAADRHRHDTSAPHIAVELAGPEVVTLGELSARLGGGGRRVGTAQSGPMAERYAPETLALLVRDAVPGPGTLGREGTPLAEGIRRTRAGA